MFNPRFERPVIIKKYVPRRVAERDVGEVPLLRMLDQGGFAARMKSTAGRACAAASAMPLTAARGRWSS